MHRFRPLGPYDIRWISPGGANEVTLDVLEQGNRVMNISLSIFVKSCACGSSEWEYTCNYDDADFPSVPMNDLFSDSYKTMPNTLMFSNSILYHHLSLGDAVRARRFRFGRGGSSESLKLKWSVHSGRATSPPSTELLRTNTGRSVSEHSAG